MTAFGVMPALEDRDAKSGLALLRKAGMVRLAALIAKRLQDERQAEASDA